MSSNFEIPNLRKRQFEWKESSIKWTTIDQYQEKQRAWETIERLTSIQMILKRSERLKNPDLKRRKLLKSKDSLFKKEWFLEKIHENRNEFLTKRLDQLFQTIILSFQKSNLTDLLSLILISQNQYPKILNDELKSYENSSNHLHRSKYEIRWSNLLQEKRIRSNDNRWRRLLRTSLLWRIYKK